MMRRALCEGLAACAALALITSAMAQSPQVQRFTLHKTMFESQIIVCVNPHGPVAALTLMAEGKTVESEAAIGKEAIEGRCIIARSVELKYVRQVWRREAGGLVLTVYEGKVKDGPTVFVPMIGFEHDEKSA
jgi:hypothetical protein